MNHEPPEPPIEPTCTGVWEYYSCGCVSPTAPKREQLPGKCPTHKRIREQIMPEIGYKKGTKQ